MSRIAIHWQPMSVKVACYMGPEQEPAFLFDVNNDRLTGGLNILVDGQCVLDSKSTENVGKPTAVKVRRVYDLLEAPLSRRWIEIMEPNHTNLVLADDEEVEKLCVAKSSYSGEDLLAQYLSQLYQVIVQKIKQTPHLRAAMHQASVKDFSWIFVVDESMPLNTRRRLEQRLQTCGFINVDVDSIWVSVCRWYAHGNSDEILSAHPLMIYDWNDQRFSVAMCIRQLDGQWECKRQELCNSANLASIARQIEKQISKNNRFDECFGPDAEHAQSNKNKRMPVVASIHDTAFKIACDVFADNSLRRYTVIIHSEESNYTTEEMPIQFDVKDVNESMLSPIEKICNVSRYIKHRYSAITTQEVFIGDGFSLPCASHAIETALGVDKDTILARDNHAAVKGALLKERSFHIMPYDCGVAISILTSSPPLGWLMVRRGSRLPLKAEKEIRLYLQQDEALGISIYMRKPDLNDGNVRYSIHGFYNITPQINERKEAVLQIIMMVDQNGQVDLKVIDQNNHRLINLQKMGIVGGMQLSSPPLHDIQELNGMISVSGYRAMQETVRINKYDTSNLLNQQVCSKYIKYFYRNSRSLEMLINDLQKLVADAGGRIDQSVLSPIREHLQDSLQATDFQLKRDNVIQSARGLLDAYRNYFVLVSKDTPWVNGIVACLSSNADVNPLMQEKINLIDTDPRWQSLRPKMKGLNETLTNIHKILSECRNIKE